MEKLIITPKAKIYDLLEAYLELEEILISAVPEFKKLKNPLLRKTITRITTIAQAAAIGGLNTGDLVNKLREIVGQELIHETAEGEVRYNTLRPSWFKEQDIVNSIDVSEMLNRGEQPVHEVLAAIKKLNEKEILEVIAPFLPAPLLDKSIGLGYNHWVDKRSGNDFRIYFSKSTQ